MEPGEKSHLRQSIANNMIQPFYKLQRTTKLKISNAFSSLGFSHTELHKPWNSDHYGEFAFRNGITVKMEDVKGVTSSE